MWIRVLTSFALFFGSNKLLKEKKQLVQISSGRPAHIYICVFCTHLRIYICPYLVHLDFGALQVSRPDP